MNIVMSFVNSLPGACTQGLIWGLMAIGLYITFRIINIADLTVDGSFATGGAVCVMLIRSGWNPILAMLMAFLAGLAAGFITGILHTKCGIPAILSGILTQFALYSINLRILEGKANQAVSVQKYNLAFSSRYVRDISLDNPIIKIILLLAITIGVLYWFFGTEIGCAIRATGSNQNMSRAQGINTNFNIVLALMISNGLVALAGGIFAQYQGSADINMGRGAIVIGLASVIIGEVIFGKIFRSFSLKLAAVSIGAIIYYLVITLVLRLGLNTDDLKLLTAAVVALFLAMPYWKSIIAQKKVKKVTGGNENA